MTIDKINSIQPFEKDVKYENKIASPQAETKSIGSKNDLMVTLSVLSTIGLAIVAIVQRKNSKEALKKLEKETQQKITAAEEKAKKAAEEVNKKVQEAVEQTRADFNKSIEETQKSASETMQKDNVNIIYVPKTEYIYTDKPKVKKPRVQNPTRKITKTPKKNTNAKANTEKTEEKTPWYSRMWHRLFGTKESEKAKKAKTTKKTRTTEKPKTTTRTTKKIKTTKKTRTTEKPKTGKTKTEPTSKKDGTETNKNTTIKRVKDYFGKKLKSLFNRKNSSAKQQMEDTPIFEEVPNEHRIFVDSPKTTSNENPKEISFLDVKLTPDLDIANAIRTQKDIFKGVNTQIPSVTEMREADLLTEYRVFKDKVQGLPIGDPLAKRFLEVQDELCNNRNYFIQNGKLIKRNSKDISIINGPLDIANAIRTTKDIFRGVNIQLPPVTKMREADLLTEYRILKDKVQGLPAADPMAERFLEVQGELWNHRNYFIQNGKLIKRNNVNTKEEVIKDVTKETTGDKKTGSGKKPTAPKTENKKPDVTGDKNTDTGKKPDVTGDKNPDVTGDKKTDVTGDKNPDVRGDKKPDVIGDKKPDAAGDKNPDVIGDKKPDVIGDKKPDVIGDKKPDVTGDKKPDAAGDKNPDVRGDKKPDVTGDKKPDAAGDKNPDAAGDKKTDVTGDKNPDVTGDKKPDVNGEQKPDVTGDKAPETPNTEEAKTPWYRRLFGSKKTEPNTSPEFTGLSEEERLQLEYQNAKYRSERCFESNMEKQMNSIEKQLKAMGSDVNPSIMNDEGMKLRLEIANTRSQINYDKSEYEIYSAFLNDSKQKLADKGLKPIDMSIEEARIQGDMLWWLDIGANSEYTISKLHSMGKTPFEVKTEEDKLQKEYLINIYWTEFYKENIANGTSKLNEANAKLKALLK